MPRATNLGTDATIGEAKVSKNEFNATKIVDNAMNHKKILPDYRSSDYDNINISDDFLQSKFIETLMQKGSKIWITLKLKPEMTFENLYKFMASLKDYAI